MVLWIVLFVCWFVCFFLSEGITLKCCFSGGEAQCAISQLDNIGVSQFLSSLDKLSHSSERSRGWVGSLLPEGSCELTTRFSQLRGSGWRGQGRFALAVEDLPW